MSGKYIPLVRIRTEHGYYTRGKCVQMSLPADCEKAMRRMMLLRQSGINEWELMVPEDCANAASGERLELIVSACDAIFLFVTEFPATYQSSVSYRLKPADSGKVEVAEMMRPSKDKNYVSELLRFEMDITDETVEKAKAGDPPVYTLEFRARSYRWAYYFIPRSSDGIDPKKLRLEESSGKLTFTDLEKAPDDRFGPGAYRCVSTAFIPVSQRYDYSLNIIDRENSHRKRIVSRYIDFPTLDCYSFEGKDTLCQVCYI